MKKVFYLCFIGLLSMACNQADIDNSNANNSEESTSKKSTTSHQTGLVEEFYANGQLKISGVLDNDGLKNGIWTSYFENGQKNSESNFLNGTNHGYSMVWYPNGNVRYFGDYKAGKRTGEWVFYEEDGAVAKKESYD